MPIPTDTLWNIRRLNLVFAISSLIGLASMGWMMWHDYNRPWRHTQTEYFNLRSALAHFTALAYESPEEQAKHNTLKKALDDADAELNEPQTKARIEELEEEVRMLAGEIQGVSLEYGNLNAELGVTVFDYEEAKAILGPDHHETIEIKKKYDADFAFLEKLKIDKDKLEDHHREKSQTLKKIHARQKTANRALLAYEKGLNDAALRDELFGPGWKRGTINFPILDYAAPKGTMGRQEVRQVFMPDIRFDYNFIDSYVTDRCITCHVSIDDPTFRKANFVDKAHAALHSRKVSEILRDANEKLVQNLAHRLAEVDTSEFQPQDISQPDSKAADSSGTNRSGARRRFVDAFVNAANIYLEQIDRPFISSDRVWNVLNKKPLDRGAVQSEIEAAFRKILAAAPPQDSEGRPLHYEKMNPTQQETFFKSLLAAMNLYLERTGRPPIKFSKVLAAHPRLDLFISDKSPHSMKKMGCTVCHEGDGQETDFVLAAHTPMSEAQKKHWEEKYYVKEAGLILADFELVEEYWDLPMHQTKYVSAGCAKCHHQIYDLSRYRTEPLLEARKITEGRQLFTQIGCINCHNVQGLSDSRKVGPDLSHVAEKLSVGFMENWIDYPNNFRPSTRMPHFFHQENSLSSSANDFDPDPPLRAQAEIKAITHYLRTFSIAYDPSPIPEGITGDPKRGEELFVSIGCLACHVNLDAHDPLDDDHRSFSERWIVRDLTFDLADQAVIGRSESSRHLDADAISEILDQVRPQAQKTYEQMHKNDRARYAMRRFKPERREAAIQTSQAEAFSADSEERDPDPLKLYVPPAFTRHGPELSGIGTKLVGDPNDASQVARGRAWLYDWLADPRHYSSSSNMPRLFRDNYYDSLLPKPLALPGGAKNDQDILDITEYLLSLRHDEFSTTPFPKSTALQKETERLILMLLGGQNTGSVSLKILNDEKMDDSESYGSLTRAIVAQTYHSFGGGKDGRQRVASMIRSKVKTLEDRQALFLGMKMISHYGCFTCHSIAGFEDTVRPGTDLSLWGQKFMTQLDFAFFAPIFEHEREEKHEIFANLYPDGPEFEHLVRDIREDVTSLITGTGGNVPQEILHNHDAFAYHKLRNPRIYDREKYKKPYEKLKMPNYFLTDDEAQALTTFLLSRRDPNVSDRVKINYKDTTTGMIAAGRALARELNCIGCHTIEGGSPATIHQYYTDDLSVSDDFPFGARFKPPLLWGEGAKIQFDWLFSFLNNVEMLRPWLRARMPSFHLTTEQTTALVEYFAGLSQDEAGRLSGTLASIHKFRGTKSRGTGVSPVDVNGSPDASSNPPWFMQDKFTLAAGFLKRYALSHQQMRPYDFDTSGATDESEVISSLTPAYEKIIQRGDFLASLFDVAYPFGDLRSHLVNDHLFKKGEAFFYDQKCLACHVAGDPTAAGTTMDVKAPNFALTYKRLRYDWVLKWLEDPQAIQPGANMPQIFQGGNAYVSLPEEQRKEKEAQFGDTIEAQGRLLVDFLFSLGERRYTAIQPGTLETTPQDESPGEEDFDFDQSDDNEGGDKKEENEEEFDFDDDG